MMAASGRYFLVRRWSCALLMALALGSTALFCAQGATAKDRDWNQKNYNNGYSSQQMQAEMERRRKEQEKAMKAAIKAMQEAQKAAQRNAQKFQAEMARQQAKSPQPVLTVPKKINTPQIVTTPKTATPTKAVPATQRNDKDDDDREKDKTKKVDRGNGGGGGLDDADAADDNDDWDLSDAERQIRTIERSRQRALVQAAREQQILLEKEAARAARIRERTVKRWMEDGHKGQAGVPPGGTASNGAPEAGASPGGGKVPPPKGPPAGPAPVADKGKADEAKGKPLQPQLAERGQKWLDAYERRASNLGMGRGGIKSAAEQAGQAKNDDGQPVPSNSENNASGKPVKGEATKVDGAERPRGSKLAGSRPLNFPGKDRGAELPVKLFEEERATELIATGISAVDEATAKAHGFVLSPPIELKGSGKAVQRIRGPAGANRDEAERELHKILPFLSVTPNQAHSIFLGSLGETDSASGIRPPGTLPGIDRRAISPASPQPCPHQTCFAGELIKWKSTLGSCAKGVRIGIIDTSFDVGHPALEHISVEQGEFLDGMPASPYDWHGTAVLSLLAGDPRSGTPGLVPDATFLLATAFRSDAAGNASTDTARLLAALAWLEGLDVDIVNMSFSGPQDVAISRAIARMSEQKGIVFIAAAGNMGPTAAPSYPAAYPSVIAVTAVNRNGENYRSANRGTYIDVAAPGVDILTALPDAKQGYRTGTSFAAPFVTAIVAARGRDVAHTNVKAQLLKQVSTRDLGPPGRDPIYGAGLALAPARCQGGGAGAVAKAAPVPHSAPEPAALSAAPEIDSWSSQTTLIKAGTAGAAFAP